MKEGVIVWLATFSFVCAVESVSLTSLVVSAKVTITSTTILRILYFNFMSSKTNFSAFSLVAVTSGNKTKSLI